MNPPGQSSIEALHTITLNLYIYRRVLGPPQSIEHKGIAYHYTASIYIYIKEC